MVKRKQLTDSEKKARKKVRNNKYYADNRADIAQRRAQSPTRRQADNQLSVRRANASADAAAERTAEVLRKRTERRQHKQKSQIRFAVSGSSRCRSNPSPGEAVKTQGARAMGLA